MNGREVVEAIERFGTDGDTAIVTVVVRSSSGGFHSGTIERVDFTAAGNICITASRPQ